MKLLIAGSRGITDLDLSEYIDFDVDLIITGGAKGVDILAEEYADKNGISKLILRPKYALYGKAAPIIRNQKMVEMCDLVYIFWDGISHGAKFTIDYAKKSGKEHKVFTPE